MQDLRPALEEGARELDLSLTPGQIDQCLAYLALLSKWARVYNLTAVRDPAQMLSHHLLDCLAVVAPIQDHLTESSDALGPPAAPRVLDVGSGAGLPGVLIAIACPAVQVSCIDTVAKKAAFIQQAASSLGLPNLRAVHGRVEALQAEPFDLVTSRAFASLADFVRLTLFHVKQPHGRWLAMKGRPTQAELSGLPPQARIERVQPLRVPGLGEDRCLVWLAPVGEAATHTAQEKAQA